VSWRNQLQALAEPSTGALAEPSTGALAEPSTGALAEPSTDALAQSERRVLLPFWDFIVFSCNMRIVCKIGFGAFKGSSSVHDAQVTGVS
jgi:hypothetical protein